MKKCVQNYTDGSRAKYAISPIILPRQWCICQGEWTIQMDTRRRNQLRGGSTVKTLKPIRRGCMRTQSDDPRVLIAARIVSRSEQQPLSYKRWRGFTWIGCNQETRTRGWNVTERVWRRWVRRYGPRTTCGYETLPLSGRNKGTAMWRLILLWASNI